MHFGQHSWGCGLICAASATRICVLEQVEGSVPLQGIQREPDKAYAIIAGHEVKGVDQEVVVGELCMSVRLKAFAECVGQRENHPLASLQSYAVLRDYLKFLITFLLCFWGVLSASFVYSSNSCQLQLLPHPSLNPSDNPSKSVSYN